MTRGWLLAERYHVEAGPTAEAEAEAGRAEPMEPEQHWANLKVACLSGPVLQPEAVAYDDALLAACDALVW